MESAIQTVSKTSLWVGRIISTLVVLFLLFDSSLAVPIGAVLLACTILYVIPSTSILGAILLAAHLGGATVTHLRAGQPFYFPIIFGVLVWGGLYLREDRLQALIPLRSPNAPSQAQSTQVRMSGPEQGGPVASQAPPYSTWRGPRPEDMRLRFQETSENLELISLRHRPESSNFMPGLRVPAVGAPQAVR